MENLFLPGVRADIVMESIAFIARMATRGCMPTDFLELFGLLYSTQDYPGDSTTVDSAI
jgi:hypothetical protein